MVQVIEDTDTGTYEASQLTLSEGSDEVYVSPLYIAMKQGTEDRLVLSTDSGSGSLTCETTTGGEGYYAALAMHVKSDSGAQFRADTQGWTVQNDDGTEYITSSYSQIYAEDPSSGHASMDYNGFEVSSTDANEYCAINKEGLTAVSQSDESGSVGPNYIEARDTDGKVGYLEAGAVVVNGDDGYAGMYGNGSLALSDGSGTATISQNSLYLTDGTNWINADVAGLGGKNAFWQEINVCVNGVAKKMKILGTEPY